MKTTNANPHRPFKCSRAAVLLCWLACFWAGTATPDAIAAAAEADENRTAAEDGDNPLARECNWNQLAFGYGETITVVRLTGQRRQETFEAEVLEEIRGYRTPKRIWLVGIDHLGDSALRAGTRWIVASDQARRSEEVGRVFAELADTEENRAKVRRWVVPAWQYTPIVMVVRVTDAPPERGGRVVFEVINVLRGKVADRYLVANAWDFEKFRPLVADGKLHLLSAWNIVPVEYTEHPLVRVESWTEITEPQIAAVKRDLAADPYARRIQQIEAGVQNLATLSNAWRFHQAPLVAEVVVNAVGQEGSSMGGTHFTMAPTRWYRGRVKEESLQHGISVAAPGPIDWTGLNLDDLKTRPAYLFYGGGHGYWGKERSGDPFIAAGWKVGAHPVARLPLTEDSQKRVRQWLSAPELMRKGDVDAAMRMAAHLLLQCHGANEEAIKLCAWILEREPKNFKAVFFLGEAYAAQGRHDKALEQFQNAKRLAEPDSDEEVWADWFIRREEAARRRQESGEAGSRGQNSCTEQPDPAAEISRLRRQNERLQAEVQKLKYTRMLVPNPHNGEGTVVIGDRRYWLEYTQSARFVHSPCYRPTGDANLAYYFRKGQGCLALNPQGCGRPREIPSRWALEALSADGTRAIVLNDELVSCLIDRAGEKVLFSLETLKEYHCTRWMFSPNGKYAYTLRGSAPGGLPYVDVGKAALRIFKPGEDGGSGWRFSGVPLDGGKLLLFANSAGHDAEGKPFRRCHVVRLDMDKPEGAVVVDDRVGVDSAPAIRNGVVLCRLFDGRIALLSVESLKVVATCDPLKNDRAVWLGFAPGRGDVYVVANGVHIHDQSNLKRLATLAVGGCSNAYTIGVTFSEDGKHAYVATPYGHYFAVIDTQRRELVAKVALKTSAAGVLLWPWEPEEGVSEKRGTCLVITTRLPWE